jgi:hypothetical protein
MGWLFTQRPSRQTHEGVGPATCMYMLINEPTANAASGMYILINELIANADSLYVHLN